MNEKKIVFLTGDRVYLRPLSEDDANGPYIQWLNDPQVCQGNSHHKFPYLYQSALEYIHFAQTTKENLILAIVKKDTDSHIGNVSLLNIHPIYHSAEFAIVLGEISEWNKGFGKEAAQLLVIHGFTSLNLNRIECGTYDTNISMKKLAESLGMKEEGRRRQAAFSQGHYIDVIEYGMTIDDFKTFYNR